MRVRNFLVLGMMALLVMATTSCTGKSMATQKVDPWLVIPGKQVGVLKADSSEADLIKAYGKENVVRHAYYIAEGFCEPGTVLFPKDENKRLEITWADPKENKFPVNIQWFASEQGNGTWHLPEGITTGTTVADLEKINGKPFKVSGIGWDYGGYVFSWENGNLVKRYPDALTVRMAENNNGAFSEKDYRSISGDGAQFFSNLKNPIVKTLTVSRIVVSFQGNIKRLPPEGAEQKSCEDFGELK